ncbi:MAG TPA: ABC-2 family transporter protein [Bacillota bacterium]|nr:ABC-2 family transporter protein [Bacillota bacterium]
MVGDKLWFYLKIYIYISSQYIKARMQYRIDFILSTLGLLAMNTAGLFSFWVVLQSIPSLGGWKFYELVFIYAFSLLASSPMGVLFNNLWNLRPHIFDGTFIKYYFKPLNMLFYYVSEVVDLKGLSQVFFALATLIYASLKLGILWNPGKLFLLMLTLVSSSLSMISMMLIAASTGFWILNANAVMVFTSRLRELTRYPLTIFNNFFRYILTFIIPIGFIAFYPAQFFLRPEKLSVLVYLSPLFGFGFFRLAYEVWKRGVNSYSGTGS